MGPGRGAAGGGSAAAAALSRCGRRVRCGGLDDACSAALLDRRRGGPAGRAATAEPSVVETSAPERPGASTSPAHRGQHRAQARQSRPQQARRRDPVAAPGRPGGPSAGQHVTDLGRGAAVPGRVEVDARPSSVERLPGRGRAVPRVGVASAARAPGRAGWAASRGSAGRPRRRRTGPGAGGAAPWRAPRVPRSRGCRQPSAPGQAARCPAPRPTPRSARSRCGRPVPVASRSRLAGLTSRCTSAGVVHRPQRRRAAGRAARRCRPAAAGPARRSVGQGAAADEPHDQQRPGRRRPPSPRGARTWGCCDAQRLLAHEPLEQLAGTGRRRPGVAQQLDGDLAALAPVPGAVHRAHRAGSDALEHHVASGDDGAPGWLTSRTLGAGRRQPSGTTIHRPAARRC